MKLILLKYHTKYPLNPMNAADIMDGKIPDGQVNIYDFDYFKWKNCKHPETRCRHSTNTF